MYHNYHKHTHESNIRTIDCVVKPTDYFNRIVELGHNKYFTTEHGYQGNILDDLRELEDFNKNLDPKQRIQLVVGTEAYFTRDPIDKENKDRASYHLIFIALNNNGVEQINKITSLANINGFYYKPRVNLDMIQEVINPNDIICTSACVAGIGALWNPESEKNIKWFKDFFGDNFYLEVQSHNHKKQIIHNKKMLEYAEKYNIELIHANDSHYIYSEDSVYRDLLLQAKGLRYPEEEGFILDYPDEETIRQRYREQGVLTEEQIESCLSNTLVFDKCEPVTLYNKDIKIPPISENPKEEFKQLLNSQWKKLRDNYPKERHKEYLQAIREEQKIISDTNMEEYFLMDYKICKVGREKYNAVISGTGRGSAGSFFLNTLLEILNMDRLDSPVTLYPTRFMSVSRILETKSLPDIDINCADQEPLIKASEDIIGKEKCGWMISFKPMQESSAFRFWCKAKGLNYEEYNEIAKNLDDFREHPTWGKIIEDSKVFVGVIESVSPSSCSMLLSPYPVDNHIGYIKIGDVICCNLDGYNCDYWKYLKNDILAATVWEIIAKTCEIANIPIPTIKELEDLLDEKTFNVYENKLTCTVNQVDSEYATNLIHRYKPKSVAEVCAFIAALRPGFASLLENFINRRPYTTGVKELDELLKDSFHYLMYQESIMKYLVWLGILEDQTYGIIKKISKKKWTEQELKELNIKLHEGWRLRVKREEGFQETWKVVEDASRYSFNASHSLAYAYDSLYCAYLKSHYPLEYYAVTLNLYQDDIPRTSRLINEMEYFNIKLERAKFRKSKAEYFIDREENSIYKGIQSIKYLNEKVGKFLWDIRDKNWSFGELITNSKGIINKTKFKILIKLNFFEEYGTPRQLLEYYELYKKYIDRKTIKKLDSPLPLDIMAKFAGKETAKQFGDIDNIGLINELFNRIKTKPLDEISLVQAEQEYTGNITPLPNQPRERCIISDIEERRKHYDITFIDLAKGNPHVFRLEKGTIKLPNLFTIVDLKRIRSTPKNVLVNGKWTKSKTEKNYWLTEIDIILEGL